MATKPSSYISWVPGGGSSIAQPTTAQSTTGWAAGQAPAFQHVNWLFYTLDQWVQWLDQQMNVDESLSGSNLINSRLLGGGLWGFDAPSNTVSWSAAFMISYPSLDDSINSITSGSRTVTDGQCLYVNANIPFTTRANTITGSAVLYNVGNVAGISVGNRITGTGINPGSTVIAIGSSTVTLSSNATSTTTQSSMTFSSTAAISVGTATWATFVPTANQIIFARRYGSSVYIGINTGQMVLRDCEYKSLLEEGYTGVISATAGQNIAKGQAVYLSVGSAAGDTGRTIGQLYLCEASAVALTQYRSNCVGVATATVSTGASLLVATSGLIDTGSVPAVGLTSYVNTASPGSLTTTKPTGEGQYVIAVGKSLGSNRMWINPAAGATATIIPTFIRIPLETLQVNTPGINASNVAWKTPNLVVPWDFRHPISGTFSIAGFTCMASGITITAGTFTCALYKNGSLVQSVALNSSTQKNSVSYIPSQQTIVGGMVDYLGAVYSTDGSFAATGTGGLTMQIWLYAV